ncbi:SAM-dependent methyltransferase [Tsukamurella strandjordii]|uniref:SAM-dependent methyltransferase n=1 Tax=Tsukamurella strandjordii TaxID=147577 RepID=UPI0031D058FC
MTEPEPITDRSPYGPRMFGVERPTAARLYDYFLGGTSYSIADRAVGREIERRAPHWAIGARLNRSYVRRVVQLMANAGIDQFLDLGSGIPTGGNVHDVARGIHPGARVVYVEKELVTFQTARYLLEGHEAAAVINLDLRDPESVLAHPTTQGLLDLSRPVGLILVGVLLFIPPDEAQEMIQRYLRVLAPGSHVAILVITEDFTDAEVASEIDWVREQYAATADRLYTYTPQQGRDLLAGTEPVEPGFVRHPLWRPELPPSPEQLRCGHGYVCVSRVP